MAVLKQGEKKVFLTEPQSHLRGSETTEVIKV